MADCADHGRKPDASSKAGWLILAFLAVLAVPVGLFLLLAWWIDSSAVQVTGRVVEKREWIAMPRGDSWAHAYEIVFQYRPLDVPFQETASQRVDASRYRALRVGSPVEVRYASSRFLRLMKGTGTYLAGTPLFGRLAYGAPDPMEFAPLAGFGAAALVGWLAYRLRSRMLGIFAILVAGAAFPVVLLSAFAFIGMPFLFWSWRRNHGVRGAFRFFGAIAVTAAIVAWRIPQPTPAPSGAVREATAVVRHVRLVDEIWTDADERPGPSEGGQPINRPFQMLDLEFTPEGAAEPIHVLDRIDLGGVPSIETGARVPVVYQVSDPAIAHIVGATRDFPRHALVYLLALTYGLGAVITFLLIPAVHVLEKRFRASAFGTILTRVENARRSARRPPQARP